MTPARSRRATGLAAAATLIAALAMIAPPAYAEDPSPASSDSPSPGVSASPAPSQAPSPEPSSPASGSPDPGESTPPGDGNPTSPGDGSPPPVDEEPPAAPVDLAVTVPGPKVTLGSSGKWVRIDVDNMGYATAEHVVLTIDVADLTDQVTVELPDEEQGCQASDTTATCAYPDLVPGDVDAAVAFKVTPKSGATEGPAGTVHVSVTSDQPDLDPDNNRADVGIELIGSGVDLTAYAAPVGPVRPGGTQPLFYGFLNQGDRTASGFSITIELPAYASFVERYYDCTYANQYRKVTCSATDFQVRPGEGVDLTGSFTVKIAKNAPGPRLLGRGMFSVAATGEESASAGTRGGGWFLGARRSATRSLTRQDMVEGDNTVAFAVKSGKSRADLAIKVAKAEGEAGDEVKVRFTVINHGPSDIGGFHLKVIAPTGADISAAPSDPKVDCTPDSGGDIGPREADCNYLERLPAGKARSFTIAFQVEAKQVGDDGRAKVDYWTDTDPNLKNNTAKIVIGPPGSTGGGGGGGGLPVTGASLLGLIGGGALALLVGGGLYLVSRRRRTIDVSVPEDAVA